MTETMNTMASVQSADTAHSPSLLTPDEIIPRLRVSRSTLYEWLAKGELPSYRLGRIIRIREIDLTEFLERRRRIAPPIRQRYVCHPTT
jgi:excisionase family DNA binding protein